MFLVSTFSFLARSSSQNPILFLSFTFFVCLRQQHWKRREQLLRVFYCITSVLHFKARSDAAVLYFLLIPLLLFFFLHLCFSSSSSLRFRQVIDVATVAAVSREKKIPLHKKSASYTFLLYQCIACSYFVQSSTL